MMPPQLDLLSALTSTLHERNDWLCFSLLRCRSHRRLWYCSTRILSVVAVNLLIELEESFSCDCSSIVVLFIDSESIYRTTWSLPGRQEEAVMALMIVFGYIIYISSVGYLLAKSECCLSSFRGSVTTSSPCVSSDPRINRGYLGKTERKEDRRWEKIFF